jgi:hypothetical protein
MTKDFFVRPSKRTSFIIVVQTIQSTVVACVDLQSLQLFLCVKIVERTQVREKGHKSRRKTFDPKVQCYSVAVTYSNHGSPNTSAFLSSKAFEHE